MKIVKFMGCVLALAAACITGCSQDNPQPSDNGNSDQLTLSASKDSIIPNGQDKAVFTVMLGSQDVTSSAQIFNQNDEQLKSSYFVSQESGSFSFYATYSDPATNQQLRSNTVTISVGSGIVLSVDQQSVTLGKTVQFSVLYDGTDVSSTAVIKNLTTDETLDSNSFVAPDYAADFEFQATYSGLTSNTVTVNVTSSLRITQSKARVQEGDQVEFEVFYEGNNVTSQAKIINVKSGEELPSNTYTYSGNGTVKFRAEYNDEFSPIVSVSDLNFYKKVLTLKFTSVQCGNCVQTTTALDNANHSYPDRMVQIACYTPAMGDDELALKNIFSLVSYFESASYLPTVYYDYDDLHAGVRSNSEVLSKIKSKAIAVPYAGIAASTVVNGSSIDVTVNVTATRDRQLYLAVFALEDGIVAPQNSGGDNYVHNHVLRGIVSDEQTMFGDDLGEMTINGQVTKKYTINASDYNFKSCSLACVVLYKDGSNWHVTNAINVPMNNGSVNYRFEG